MGRLRIVSVFLSPTLYRLFVSLSFFFRKMYKGFEKLLYYSRKLLSLWSAHENKQQ